jgi:3-methylcrotonyl-CoA carboxylase alpha subunit
MTEAAVAAARAANYRNAGTIEFLVDGDAFYFLEMNTRLQVEHPVTEQVLGLDLVRAQLLVADGQPLPWTQEALAPRGHAIEARVYAEDPAHGFLPQAGRLADFREPRRPGVRVDAGVVAGSDVSVYYDPLIAKVIATAETRELATARLAAALREFAITGVRTNIGFLVAVLESTAFRTDGVDTAFLDRESAALAASAAAEARPHDAAAPPTGAESVAAARASYDPWAGASAVSPASARRSSRQAPSVRRRSSGAGASLQAPMPATVIKIQVKPGDTVKKGDTVLLLEAMKMELPIRAPGDGVVAAVCCKEGELVAADATLVEFERT